jgi:hypothetical protein
MRWLDDLVDQPDLCFNCGGTGRVDAFVYPIPGLRAIARVCDGCGGTGVCDTPAVEALGPPRLQPQALRRRSSRSVFARSNSASVNSPS